METFASLLDYFNHKVQSFKDKIALRRRKVLIISNKKKLITKYGNDVFNKYLDYKNKDSYLYKLQGAMRKDDVTPRLIYVDDEKSTKRYGLDSILEFKDKNLEAGAVQTLVREFGERYYNRNKVTDVLIIGGHDIIPFFKVPNPVLSHLDKKSESASKEFDFDTDIYLDVPYGSSEEFDPDRVYYLVSDWAVGRLPDGNSKLPEGSFHDITLLRTEIQTAIDAHKHSSQNIKAVGCITFEREEIAEEVYKKMASEGLFIAKQQLETRARIQDCKFHYYGLHGTPNNSGWTAKDIGTNDDRPALLSQDIDEIAKINQEAFSGAIICVEVCWGAKIIAEGSGSDDVRNSRVSMALRFLEKGAKCFVGPTAISYGWDNTFKEDKKPLNADIIASKFLERISDGRRFGEALWQAKVEYFGEEIINDPQRIRTQEYFEPNDYAIKTLMEFVLLGDPTVRERRNVRGNRKAN